MKERKKKWNKWKDKIRKRRGRTKLRRKKKGKENSVRKGKKVEETNPKVNEKKKIPCED
jgi:hypothetical protein